VRRRLDRHVLAGLAFGVKAETRTADMSSMSRCFGNNECGEGEEEREGEKMLVLYFVAALLGHEI
jgi:hypothetical protein